MRPSATATGCLAVLAVAAMVTFTAIAESRRRGHWCSSPRFVVTIYAAINKPGTALVFMRWNPWVLIFSFQRVLDVVLDDLARALVAKRTGPSIASSCDP